MRTRTLEGDWVLGRWSHAEFGAHVHTRELALSLMRPRRRRKDSGDGIKMSGLNTTFLQVILTHDQLK